MADRNGYIGRAPGDSAVIIASQTFEPTGIQTDFTFAAGYTVGYLDVYFNGARLIYANDYVAANGTTVGLTTYANNGDVIECVAYKSFNLGNISESPGNFSVGNQLTVVGATTATTAYYTGIVTASSFYGDGSTLTGVANTDNIITGTAVTITGAANAVTLNVSGITTVGILTVYDTTQSTSASTGALVVHGGVGIAKSLFVDGNVTIGGTLTYEDMTNTDNLGFGTFRKGIEVQGAGSTTTTFNVTGVSTFSGDIRVPDDKKLQFGNIGGANGDLQLWHDAGQHSYIRDQGSGDLRIYGSAVDIRDNAGTASVARFTDNSVHLAGITTVGILTAYESITVKVGTGSTELATAINTNTTNIATKASTGKAIAMAMVFGF